MYLIVGLGNPEPDYKGTRHNIGFEVINKFVYDKNLKIERLKHKAYIEDAILFDQKVILAKPQTYMNLSGESVLEIAKYYKINPENIIVIYDDITLEVGNIKIKKFGSSGGHNGIKNIIYNLNTDKFPRIKVGVGSKPKEMILSDYVLSRFLPEEFDNMVKGVTSATDSLDDILKNGLEYAMNKHNKKNK